MSNSLGPDHYTQGAKITASKQNRVNNSNCIHLWIYEYA